MRHTLDRALLLLVAVGFWGAYYYSGGNADQAMKVVPALFWGGVGMAGGLYAVFRPKEHREQGARLSDALQSAEQTLRETSQWLEDQGRESAVHNRGENESNTRRSN